MIEGIPDSVGRILEILENKGFESYLVGGCVRDLLLGKCPKDWDICTAAKPQEMKELFPLSLDLGAKFGTLGVQTSEGIVEITTFREEGAYLDCRHPQVSFVGDVRLDLKRRDFSINAMAYHPKKGLIDDFGGREDLSCRVLRSVGEADLRFQEDALRILRLVRFSCVLGFAPQIDTLQSALRFKQNLLMIAKERIRDELVLALQGEFFVDFFKTYEEIFALVLPELKKPRRHKISNLSLLFAFLLEGDESYKALERLKFSKAMVDRVRILLRYKNFTIEENRIALKLLLKEIGYDCLMALLELKKINGENVKKPYALVQGIMIDDECFCLKDLSVNGEDMKKLGFLGEEIGKVLEKLLLDVIYERIPNQKESLIIRAIEEKSI